MSDDKNPEEKPSFFDSVDESKAWPPADNYETEENNLADDSSSKSFFDSNDFENAFSGDQTNSEAASTEATGDDYADSDDFLDQLIDNVDEKNNINNMRIIDDEAEEETPVEILQEPAVDDELSVQEIDSNKQETDASYDEDLENDFNIDNINNENELLEPIVAEDSNDDFDLDDLIEPEEPAAASVIEETPESTEETISNDLLNSDIGTTDMAYVDPEGFANDLKSDLESGFDDDDEETIFIEKPSPQIQETEEVISEPIYEAEDYAQSEFVEFIDDDASDDLKPFRTFTKINLAEELADENEESEESAGMLAGMNKNVLIILAIIILSLAYFLFNTFFNREIETRSRARRRPPRKEKTFGRIQQVLTPVWEVASQETATPELDDKYAKSLIKFTGRDNPFAMPRSVLAALKRQADLELLSKKKPNTYKRLAYRATLLGVLTSEGSTIALINMQEASFTVIEGTNKNKILKLATKTMDKAKKNTLEMGRGSFIGPWEIINVSKPSGAFSDAKITVEFQGIQKVLSMGKAEDLGIFDPAGQIDDLETPDGNLDEDPDDDFDF